MKYYKTFKTIPDFRIACSAAHLYVDQQIDEGNAESGPQPPTGGLVARDGEGNEYGYFDLFDDCEGGVLFEDHEDYFAYCHCAFDIED